MFVVIMKHVEDVACGQLEKERDGQRWSPQAFPCEAAS